MNDDAAMEYGGVRIDLSHLLPVNRAPMISAAQRWMESGARPPLLTVHADCVDVSTRPDLWPAQVRDYRGLGRLEWVGQGGL